MALLTACRVQGTQGCRSCRTRRRLSEPKSPMPPQAFRNRLKRFETKSVFSLSKTLVRDIRASEQRCADSREKRCGRRRLRNFAPKNAGSHRRKASHSEHNRLWHFAPRRWAAKPGCPATGTLPSFCLPHLPFLNSLTRFEAESAFLFCFIQKEDVCKLKVNMVYYLHLMTNRILLTWLLTTHRTVKRGSLCYTRCF